MDAFLGMIAAFGFSWEPKGWTFCNGATMAIAQNSALYALLGAQFGGDGRTTFGLPDLRGRTLIGQLQGPGLTNRVIGEMGGHESVTLTQNEMPAHTHPLKPGALSQAGIGSEISGDATTPTNNYLALSPKIGSGPNATRLKTYATTLPAPVAPATTSMPSKLAGSEIKAADDTIGAAGGSRAHANMQPFLTINYCIALSGIFPSRN